MFFEPFMVFSVSMRAKTMARMFCTSMWMKKKYQVFRNAPQKRAEVSGSAKSLM